MKQESLPLRVTGIFRVKSPTDTVDIKAGEDGVIRAKLLSGIEIEVADGKVTYQYEDYKVHVIGGVNFDDLEIVDEKTKRVRQPITPRQRLEFFSRIAVDTVGFEEIVVES